MDRGEQMDRRLWMAVRVLVAILFIAAGLAIAQHGFTHFEESGPSVRAAGAPIVIGGPTMEAKSAP